MLTPNISETESVSNASQLWQPSWETACTTKSSNTRVHGSPLDKLLNPDTTPLLEYSNTNFSFPHPRPSCATTLHLTPGSQLNQS